MATGWKNESERHSLARNGVKTSIPITKKSEAEYNKNEAISELRKLLPPGTTVYTKLNHVARSGMSRSISVYIVSSYSGAIQDITWDVARSSGDKIDKYNGITVGGCGMDMGFHTVYSLSRRLYPNGFDCVGEKCQSNDHFNGDKMGYKPHKHTSDGGYALNHRWL